MIETAVNGAKDYIDVAQKEQEEMNDLSNFLDVAKNRRPYSNVDGNDIPKGGQSSVGVKALTRHEQKEYYTETYNGATKGYRRAVTSILPIQTYQALMFKTSSFSNSNYYYMTMKYGNSESNLGAHWLASCYSTLHGGSLVGYFGVQYVSGCVSYRDLFGSHNANTTSFAYSVRPMVEIPLDTIILGGTGGTIEEPISIQKR